MNGIDMDALSAWVGRDERVAETIGPTPVQMLAATLDHDDAPPREGQPIPPLAHWCYTIPPHRHSELAEDGHVRRGGFMPPVPLPRRMFAGARIRFVRPLRIGESVRRTGTVTALVPKTGRSGQLLFASVRQEIVGEDGLALVEEQDIVYRSHSPEASDAPQAGDGSAGRPTAEARRSYVPNEAMLFRYSALIFNAHRIHYDRPYATGHEGYPGLVVHGQLVATCLADLAWRHWGRPLAGFSFRARRPLFDGTPFAVNAATRPDGGIALWATDAEDRVAMHAEAEFSPG